VTSRTSEDAYARMQREALEAKNDELARANAELSQFAYMASHELQAPLHKISQFAELLASRLDGKLDPEAKDFFARLTGSVETMERLIEDLLALSRVTTRGQPFEEVSLRQIVDAVLVDHAERIAESRSRVEVGPLPRLRADALQMRELFYNLIGNALKFRRPGQPAIVRVFGRSQGNGYCEIVVEDDGIGFEQQHAERILKPFQRLHSRASYDGTGLGLAICDKIALRHGGAITAKGVPGKGAAFIVVLPTPYQK
jgi:light-regulated signal transduction histidine kinase (bacteriophytochrome)